MTLFRISIVLLALVSLSFALRFPAGMRDIQQKHPQHKFAAAQQPPMPQYTIRHFNQTLDHFNYQTENQKFLQRYIVSTDYWIPSHGPILFYTGNEGDIFMFWNNTGFMFYLAEKFGGLIVFAEHRYYGESLPFGAESFRDKNLAYLTSEQALADYADLLRFIKRTLPGANNVPVIAFGGSYGGMLASWFRIKYPNIVDGSLASSAPVAQFGNLTSPYEFNEIITQDFARSGPSCADNIRKGFQQIIKVSTQSGGLQQLTKSFNLCTPLRLPSEAYLLVEYLSTAYTYMAMTDYPYPTDFLQQMPGWPVQVACTFLPPNVTDLFGGMLQAASVYYGPSNCTVLVAPVSPSLGQTSWDYQACTEMVMPISSNGITDMFLPSTFNVTATVEDCAVEFKTTTRPDWIPLQYGAREVAAASNIIYSNGELDPWRAGGVLVAPSPLITCITIPKAAHHLDLRYPNPLDPQSVTDARKLEEETIRSWIDQARRRVQN